MKPEDSYPNAIHENALRIMLGMSPDEPLPIDVYRQAPPSLKATFDRLSHHQFSCEFTRLTHAEQCMVLIKVHDELKKSKQI
jgi:hypothetical protein